MSFDGPERTLSPERPDTGSLLDRAIKRRLSNADQQVFEEPNTTKSEGFPTQTVEAPEPRTKFEGTGLAGARVVRKLNDRRKSINETVSSTKINALGRDMSRSFNNKENFRVGDIWTLKDKRVVKVLFAGQPNPPFLRNTSSIEDKKWVGLQVMSGQAGKNDGRGPRGKRYFECPKAKGLFMRQKDFKAKLVSGPPDISEKHIMDQLEMYRTDRATDIPCYEETKVLEAQAQASLTETRPRSQSNPEGRSGRAGPFGLFNQPSKKRGKRSTARAPRRYQPNSNPWKPKRYDLSGHNATALSQKNMHRPDRKNSRHRRSRDPAPAGRNAHKAGPRQIGRNRTKLASEAAGITPWKASEHKYEVGFKQRFDMKGMTTLAMSQKDMYGHHKESRGAPAGGMSGHKLGPREIRRQGDRTKLASEMAGIAPMTAQQSAAIDPNRLFGAMRYDTKGFTTIAASQKDMFGHHKESTGGGASHGGHKLGPREIRRQGDHTKLASEMAGISPAKSTNYNPNQLFGPQRYDTKGFTSTAKSQKDLYGHHKVSTTGGAGFGGHKLGPREIRNQGDRTKLASEMAGIAPATAQQSAAHDPNSLFGPMRYDRKGMTTTARSQKDLYGHHKVSTSGGAGFGGHKLGPREIRRQGDQGKLASEMAGIAPMTAQQSAAHDPNKLYQPMNYDTKGFTTTALSRKDLYGHHKESTGGTAFGGKKLGPREIRQQADRSVLASEAAGIKPMTAQQSAAHDPDRMFAPQRHDRKGFTTTALSRKDLYGHHKQSSGGGAGFSGHKMGPREIRAQGDNTQLASVAAGITSMTAQQSAAHDPSKLYQPMRYDRAGLTTTALSQKDLYGHHKDRSMGGGGFAGHKQGPREIGQNRALLASEAAGIRPASAQASAADHKNLFGVRHDTRGFTAMH